MKPNPIFPQLITELERVKTWLVTAAHHLPQEHSNSDLVTNREPESTFHKSIATQNHVIQIILRELEILKQENEVQAYRIEELEIDRAMEDNPPQ